MTCTQRGDRRAVLHDTRMDNSAGMAFGFINKHLHVLLASHHIVVVKAVNHQDVELWKCGVICKVGLTRECCMAGDWQARCTISFDFTLFVHAGAQAMLPN